MDQPDLEENRFQRCGLMPKQTSLIWPTDLILDALARRFVFTGRRRWRRVGPFGKHCLAD